MKYFTINNKVYNSYVFYKKVVPKLLRLIYYIKDCLKELETKRKRKNLSIKK